MVWELGKQEGGVSIVLSKQEGGINIIWYGIVSTGIEPFLLVSLTSSQRYVTLDYTTFLAEAGPL